MPSRLLALLFLAALVAQSAQSAPLLFEGTYSLLGLGALTPVGTGTGIADVNAPGLGGAHLTQLAIPGGLATVMSTSTPTPSGTLPLSQLVVTVRDGSGAFSETSAGALTGRMPLTGNVRVCVFFNCAVFLDLPLTENGTRGVGLGGPPIVASIGTLFVVSLEGAPWTTGVVTAMTTFSTFASTGSAQGPALLSSSTALPSGMVQLVTPIRVSATESGGVPTLIEFFGVFDVRLVPEPTAGLLLLAGAGAVLALGRVRRY